MYRMSPIHQESQLILLDLSEGRYPQLPEWAEWLSDSGFHVHLASWGLDEDCIPDIIITSKVVSPELQARFSSELQSELVSTISIESESACEFYVSKDSDRDQFNRVVDMVAKIVHLRRRLKSNELRIRNLSSLAMTDPLTGIANRRAWSDELNSRLVDKEAICIAIIDADFFKAINDQDGHNIGDQVLRKIARAMRAKLRGRDFLARLGGDEFGLLISDVDHDVADSIVERIRSSVTKSLAKHHLPSVTLSAGYVFIEKYSGVTEELLYALASKSLQVAKRKQRNCTYGHLV
jgi:diguanylate cyclase (GGDEF)-like protein